MKIIKIKKRNAFVCFWSINEWNVWVEHDGKIYKYKCYANVANPNKSVLLWDLRNKLRFDINLEELVGTEI